MTKPVIVYDLDIDVTYEDLTAEEKEQASLYLTSGMVIADTASRATKSNILNSVAIVPCNGWCCDTSKTTWVLRHAGNDETITLRLYMENIEHGLHAACRSCSDKYFKLADALDHHLHMLRCRASRDDRGAIKAATKRGEVLKQLGYTTA